MSMRISYNLASYVQLSAPAQLAAFNTDALTESAGNTETPYDLLTCIIKASEDERVLRVVSTLKRADICMTVVFLESRNRTRLQEPAFCHRSP